MSLLAVVVLLANAEVVDSSTGGFTVHSSVQISAPPDEVYRRLIHNVGEWWNPVHTFSHDAHNLRIEDRPGGCLCEKLPDGGFVRHMELVNLAPGKSMVFSGALGPMQAMAATGTMQIQISAADSGTKVDVTYAISGYYPKGLQNLAAPVDMVVAEQFTRLKSYIELGNPAPSK
jgi:hypothetical protein